MSALSIIENTKTRLFLRDADCDVDVHRTNHVLPYAAIIHVTIATDTEQANKLKLKVNTFDNTTQYYASSNITAILFEVTLSLYICVYNFTIKVYYSCFA